LLRWGTLGYWDIMFIDDRKPNKLCLKVHCHLQLMMKVEAYWSLWTKYLARCSLTMHKYRKNAHCSASRPWSLSSSYINLILHRTRSLVFIMSTCLNLHVWLYIGELIQDLIAFSTWLTYLAIEKLTFEDVASSLSSAWNGSPHQHNAIMFFICISPCMIAFHSPLDLWYRDMDCLTSLKITH
jgi:hypothetical protein